MPIPMSSPKHKTIETSQLRIIAGVWRGRKLTFPIVPGLRPTSDRVRETLFNWLTPKILGAHCLDLFAGSGALGFEALSRGAKSIWMVDSSTIVLAQIRKNARILEAEQKLTLYCSQIPSSVVPINTQKFDIIFLDPPFQRDLLAPCCQWLQSSNCLASGALIYIEAEKELRPLPVPDNWELLRSKAAGQVGYYLLANNSLPLEAS